MWWRRSRKRGKSVSTKSPQGDHVPFDVPGYGLAPVTKAYDGSPAPAVYGIPPETPPMPSGPRSDGRQHG
jgi:hypothetical protein